MPCPFPIPVKTIGDILREHPGMPTTHLNVAQGGVYLKPTAVQIVLGSCLAVCFHVPARGIGATFHAFLPRSADFENAFRPTPYTYVDTAIAAVMATLKKLQVVPKDIQVQITGGANALLTERMGIGCKNVNMAREALAGLGLRVMRSDVGGPTGRKIIFLTGTGALHITRLRGISP